MVNHKGLKKFSRPLPLMKRINAVEGGALKKVDWQAEIAESLMYLLNAHQGSAMVAHDFGLPDFSPEAVSIHSLRHYEKNMQSVIRKYEPRFKEIEVVSSIDHEHKNRLIFHFRGFLEEAYSMQKISYYSVMTDHGRIMMRAA